jgi:hypothetical protein
MDQRVFPGIFRHGVCRDHRFRLRVVEGQCILAVTGYLAVGWVGKPETPSDIGGAIDGIEPIHMCFCTSDCHLAQVYVSGESQGCAWRVRVLRMIVRMIPRYGVMGK